MTYSTGKPLPPRWQWVPRVFFRDGAFYVIDLPADADLAEQARCNPGTRRIEDARGNVLWAEDHLDADRISNGSIAANDHEEPPPAAA